MSNLTIAFVSDSYGILCREVIQDFVHEHSHSGGVTPCGKKSDTHATLSSSSRAAATTGAAATEAAPLRTLSHSYNELSKTVCETLRLCYFLSSVETLEGSNVFLAESAVVPPSPQQQQQQQQQRCGAGGPQTEPIATAAPSATNNSTPNAPDAAGDGTGPQAPLPPVDPGELSREMCSAYCRYIEQIPLSDFSTIAKLLSVSDYSRVGTFFFQVFFRPVLLRISQLYVEARLRFKNNNNSSNNNTNNSNLGGSLCGAGDPYTAFDVDSQPPNRSPSPVPQSTSLGGAGTDSSTHLSRLASGGGGGGGDDASTTAAAAATASGLLSAAGLSDAEAAERMAQFTDDVEAVVQLIQLREVPRHYQDVAASHPSEGDKYFITRPPHSRLRSGLRRGSATTGSSHNAKSRSATASETDSNMPDKLDAIEAAMRASVRGLLMRTITETLGNREWMLLLRSIFYYYINSQVEYDFIRRFGQILRLRVAECYDGDEAVEVLLENLFPPPPQPSGAEREGDSTHTTPPPPPSSSATTTHQNHNMSGAPRVLSAEEQLQREAERDALRQLCLCLTYDQVEAANDLVRDSIEDCFLAEEDNVRMRRSLAAQKVLSALEQQKRQANTFASASSGFERRPTLDGAAEGLDSHSASSPSLYTAPNGSLRGGGSPSQPSSPVLGGANSVLVLLSAVDFFRTDGGAATGSAGSGPGAAAAASRAEATISAAANVTPRRRSGSVGAGGLTARGAGGLTMQQRTDQTLQMLRSESNVLLSDYDSGRQHHRIATRTEEDPASPAAYGLGARADTETGGGGGGTTRHYSPDSQRRPPSSTVSGGVGGGGGARDPLTRYEARLAALRDRLATQHELLLALLVSLVRDFLLVALPRCCERVVREHQRGWDGLSQLHDDNIPLRGEMRYEVARREEDGGGGGSGSGGRAPRGSADKDYDLRSIDDGPEIIIKETSKMFQPKNRHSARNDCGASENDRRSSGANASDADTHRTAQDDSNERKNASRRSSTHKASKPGQNGGKAEGSCGCIVM